MAGSGEGEDRHERPAEAAQVGQQIAVVEADGVALEKRIRQASDGMCQLVFTARSSREEPMAFRIEDTLPADFPPDKVGFHPDFDKENWRIDDHRPIHETTIEPGAEFLTIYAVRPTDAVPDHAFRTAPTIDVRPITDEPSMTDPDSTRTTAENGQSIDASKAEGPVTGPSDDEIAQRVASVELDADDDVAGQSSEGSASQTTENAREPRDHDGPAEDDEGEENPKPVELADPNTDDTDASDSELDLGADIDEPADEHEGDDPSTVAVGSMTTFESAATETPPETADKTPPSHVAALATELSDGTASVEAVDALREELLGSAMAGQDSHDARLRHVEQELNELAAYKEAMASFLDEHGSGQELLDELDERTTQNATELESVTDAIDEMDDTVEALETREGVLTEMEADIECFSEQLTTLQDERESTVAQIEAHQARLDTVTEQLETLRVEYGGTADELEAELAAVSADVKAVRNWCQQFSELLEQVSTTTPQPDPGLGESETVASIDDAGEGED